MSTPNWNKTLGEATNHQTIFKIFTSPKTGNEYTAEIIEKLDVLAIGTSEETIDGQFRYSIVDTHNDLDYVIKAPNKVVTKFGTKLRFINVRGGSTPNGRGWYAADAVEIVQNYEDKVQTNNPS